MRCLFTFIFVFAAGFSIQSQTLSGNYLKKIPVLPKDSCNITRVNMEKFAQDVSDIMSQLESEIGTLNNAVDQQNPANEEAAKETAMKQMSQQYGLSAEQMKQMQAGKMSAADKQALANQVLQQQTNMSMGEVKNLSKMSEAGKKAYAEALGAEMMATSQAGQNKQPANSGATLQQLIMQQQALMGKINASAQNIGNAYNAVESDPNLQKMLKNIDTWHSKIMSMSGVDAGQGRQMDSLAVLIKNTQIKICQNYTPKYRAAIRNHHAQMKASFPDQQKLGEITSEMTRLQTGIIPPAEQVEIGKLQSILGYLSKLQNAYQYKLYFPEEN